MVEMVETAEMAETGRRLLPFFLWKYKRSFFLNKNQMKHDSSNYIIRQKEPWHILPKTMCYGHR